MAADVQRPDAARRIIFDHGPLVGPTAFEAPQHLIRADTPDEMQGAFDAIERHRAEGFWLAGYLSYEAGFVFEPKLAKIMPEERSTPLMLFGVFDAPRPAHMPALHGTPVLAPPQPLWSFDRYATAFAQVQNHLARGDFYQANLTFPLTTRFAGAPLDLYTALSAKQAVPHGAFVDLGGPVILSRSPELFFATDAQGRIEARPMKGTAPRGATTVEDAARKEWLQKSEKNQAENVMIVDLLRNDISRLAEVGTVDVPDLFTIETYKTVHQMTSRVTAQLRPDLTFREVVAALFPCGSITGAPKLRTMEILRALEGAARDVYCGSIGWIAPDRSMHFNVAIRTLICHPDGTARLNVGGGVVFDSKAEDEYAEALLKSHFAHLHEGH